MYKLMRRLQETNKHLQTAHFTTRNSVFNIFCNNNAHMQYLKSSSCLLSQEEVDEFMNALPPIVEDLTSNPEFEDIGGLKDHIKKLLSYLLPHGKKNRSLLAIAAYKMLEKKENITPNNMRRVYIFAWIIEVFGAFGAIIDDIVDRSDTRRKRPCWHTINDRHLESINDALFLEQAGHYLIKKYLSDHKHYLTFMDICHDSLMKLSIGQLIDCMCKKNGEVNWDYFTMESFSKIAMLKTGSNIFLPGITAAMYLANVTDPNLLDNKELKHVLLNMSEYYQVQNDFWDCYADPEATGKNGNDIREGKCSWLAVKALEIANPEQEELMKKFYGKDTAESEKRIRDLYEELDLKKYFAKYEEESLKKVWDSIQKVPKEFPHQLLYELSEKIYKKSVKML